MKLYIIPPDDFLRPPDNIKSSETPLIREAYRCSPAKSNPSPRKPTITPNKL